MTRIVHALARINGIVALLVGLALIGCVALILAEIVARRFGAPLGGTDEISGYVMAGATSWGIAYALSERAHVRIDLLRARAVPSGRAVFDAIAILALAATAVVVAWRGWAVVAKTLQTGARANTSLETPLWIPQVFWWSGWIWFAVSAVVIACCTFALLAQRRFAEAEAAAGMESEL